MHKEKVKKLIHCFTVDVEDWFHVLDLPNTPIIDNWEKLESRIEKNTYKMLELLEKHQVRATMFILGWIAERHKSMVREIHKLGHEVASHGYSHILYHKSNKEDIRFDIRYSKHLLEDIIGDQVIGFRAPGFSAKRRNLWIFDEIFQAGYQYDSSIFPALRTHGGNIEMPVEPFRFKSGLIEFPVGVINLCGIKIPFGGGGYFRLYPITLFKYFSNVYAKKTLNQYIFYIHPREIDPKQPRITMNLMRRFQTYINLENTYIKLDRLLNIVNFGTLLKDRLYSKDIPYFCLKNKPVSMMPCSQQLETSREQ